MKNRFRNSVVTLTIGLIIGLASLSLAQPPDPPSNHGSGGNQSPGGFAPVGSGLVIMLGFGAAYGSRKVYRAWKKLDE